MSDKKTRTKIVKRPPGLVIAAPIPRPADPDDPSLRLFREAKAAQEQVNATTEREAGVAVPTLPPTTSYHLLPPPTTTQPEATIMLPVAPTRDFSRVANSITRNAIPEGIFKGTSKKLYDALYLRTRGAVVPVREIKAKQGDLMQWADVSHNTLRAHLRHLESVQLIKIKWELGDNSGAIYEVRLPEEVDFQPPPTTSLQPPPTTTQNLGGPSNQNLVGGGGGQVPKNAMTSETPNTFIKTNTENDDDEAYAALLRLLTESHIELSGRLPLRADMDRWREIGEILVTELKMAAARTESISNVPAFLAEHLRRRLWKKDKRQLQEEAAIESTRPARLLTPEQIKSCPDCLGTGTYYPAGNNPEGWAKGAAKCRHEHLPPHSEGESVPVENVSQDVSRSEIPEKGEIDPQP